ncbi:Glycoside hydrolase [Venustampulla echinocandica]|uniref:Probable beta-glucosidase btgE n=1 Tax=Venustampulla echinocandica TaxID=2656787 RepID=A0A370TMQ6_9HELO|nr:Glycoside hydrolase [Venustampulla echinocandica]RDL36799.1 Glycoside hydrolase [Venustampulla echinocandica]
MKTTLLVAAAALASGVSARQNHAARRHNHEAFHMEKRGLMNTGLLSTGAPAAETCGCTTIYTTITGEGSLWFPPPPATTAPPPPPPSSAAPVPSPTPTSTDTVVVVTVPVVPTPFSTTCPTPGVYTIPATTITLTETKTIPEATTTATYPPGTYTQPQVVTTITETNYVVVCPYTSSQAPAPTSKAAPAPAPVPVTTAVPAPSKSASPPSTGGLGSSGKQWAITYSPYTEGGECKAANDVAEDIKKVAAAGFTTVRVYSSDCSGLQNIGNACEAHGLKMILGVFISNTGIAGAQQQVTDIIAWGKFSMVELIVVGNEAIFQGHASATDLAVFISACKSKFQAAGYNGPCTTTEPLSTWQANKGALCGAVDVVGANIHAFFNPDTPAEKAGTFVKGQLDIVDQLCPGKSGINLECGWPSAGSCNGAACPGKEAQAVAIKSITEACGGQSVMFSFTNDPWKQPGEFGCEQYWGVIQLFT